MTYANITNLLETKKFCSALVKAPLPCRATTQTMSKMPQGRIRQSIINF